MTDTTRTAARCVRCNEFEDAGVHDTIETCEEVRGPCLDPARHHPFVARSGDTTRTAVARDVLARAILEGSGQSQIARRPDDGFEWYGAANDLADAILAALAGSAYTLAPSSESVTPHVWVGNHGVATGGNIPERGEPLYVGPCPKCGWTPTLNDAATMLRQHHVAAHGLGEPVTPASEVEPGLRTFDPARLAEALWETSVRHDEAPWVDAPDVDRTGTLGWAIVILDYLGIGAAAAVPAVTPRTEDEFRERACPSCGEVLAPADTHWDLMADRYLCAVPAVTPASTETLRAALERLYEVSAGLRGPGLADALEQARAALSSPVSSEEK